MNEMYTYEFNSDVGTEPLFPAKILCYKKNWDGSWEFFINGKYIKVSTTIN